MLRVRNPDPAQQGASPRRLPLGLAGGALRPLVYWWIRPTARCPHRSKCCNRKGKALMNSSAKNGCPGCNTDNPEGSRFCVVCGDVMGSRMRQSSGARGENRHGERSFLQRPELLSASGVALAVLLLGAVWIATSRQGAAYAVDNSNASDSYNGSNSTSGSGDTANPPEPSTSDTSTPVSTIDPAQSRQVAASVSAPPQAPDAVDGAGNPVSYPASNMLDDDPSTAWRMVGDGSGSDITVSLDQSRTVTSLGMINGYAKTDSSTGTDRYSQERQITQVTWTLDNGQTVTQQLTNSTSPQLIDLNTPTSASSVTLHIDSTTGPGDPHFDFTAISEVVVNGQ